jgi:hypothetical protein
MRKHTLLTLLLLLTTSLGVFSQLPFLRERFSAPYVPITTVGGATQLPTINGFWFTGVPIGFTFNYLSQNFINMSVGKYGYVALGSPASFGFPDDNIYLFYPGTMNNIIAPYWDYLYASSSFQPEILYQTVGTAGSRKFTIQWGLATSYRPFGTDPYNYIEFQAMLYEGTNIIEFRYGFSTQSTPNPTESASIGLKGTGGYGGYLDAITGSSFTYSYMSNSADHWPNKNFRFTPGVPTKIPGGTYTVGQTGDYTNLADAVATLNNRGMSGSITLNLIDPLYDKTLAGGENRFPILLGPINGLTGTDSLRITSSVNSKLVSGGAIKGGAWHLFE